ncbi:MAG: hypothetical protein R3279_05615 [Putridiphycobacter sp.]|nr:hypothetical protein [Putridiphycobacter sp.]
MKHSEIKHFRDYSDFENINFLKETCEQINKDLNGFTDKQVKLTEQLLEDPISNLIAQLNPIILHLEAANHLKPFIYTIDLPENKFLNYLHKKHDLSQFIFHIIERSAQKVFFRWRFSNKINH